MFLWIVFVFFAFLLSPLSFFLPFVVLRLIWLVLFAFDWSMMWVVPFHRRKSTNSSRAYRSGRIKFSERKTGVFFAFFRFPIDWLQIGRWSIIDRSPTALWSSSRNLVAVGVVFCHKSKIEGGGDLKSRVFCSLCNSQTVWGWFADSSQIGVRQEQKLFFPSVFWFLNCG